MVGIDKKVVQQARRAAERLVVVAFHRRKCVADHLSYLFSNEDEDVRIVELGTEKLSVVVRCASARGKEAAGIKIVVLLHEQRAKPAEGWKVSIGRAADDEGGYLVCHASVTLGLVVRRLAIVAIIGISLGAPITELFDRWDQKLQAGSDTEANVAVVALCVGVAFAVGTIVVVNRIRALSATPGRHVTLTGAAPREITSLLRPVPTVSPPAILRV
jgi:hypothetical protein